ncbi:glucosaminidase domain-containing protein [Candidatus Nomurabacteria bacterium]|nr:glucosaminidase domain-containing protein [Candidatus Nomurabacteria bacterium]
MKNTKLIRIAQSFIMFPIMTMPMSFGALPQTGAGLVATIQSVGSQENVISRQLALQEVEELAKKAEEVMAKKAEAIDNYFKERSMPLYGMGMKMVIEGEKNGLDWRLIPAIAVRESTGGKFECQKVENNPFGWGSCKIGFKSNEHAIETVARNLGGNNPNTAHHYDEKTTIQILRAYNPPSIVPKYAEQVVSIMNKIAPLDMEVSNNEVAKNI